ncbi:efflux RND transporter periplasmic adaptor subunit [Paroceanicella profunda]|uniref:Efflux RND transporter periplasmic adaptor subunit n=1 Tax=Paroceanicella profunda TaxID=2579971 RepID=A0A5B8FH26_9RHOB|nr:efflux RND transporter periplasmic adaptor subunit [Paroceanicella profunda]QDL91528.1 efflux RND transporter periplasmic adaptor subunit [Paroceanicella profunda]
MGMVRQAIISIVVLGAAGAGIAAFSPDARDLLARVGIDTSPLALTATQEPAATGRADRAVGVITATAETARAATRLRLIGSGRALRSVTLFARSTGEVEELGFTSGEKVARGTILARLDSDAEEIAVDRAKVAEAEADAAFERLTALAARRIATQVDLDEADRTRQRAQLDLRTAELALERRLVRAPFDGVVGLSEVDVGDLIGADTAIAVLDDRSKLEIDLYAPERFAALIGLGQTLIATTPATPGAVFNGTVTAIDSQVDSESRTLRLRAAIDNSDDMLRPGFSFNVVMSFPGESHVAVPALAVQWRADGPFVWTVTDGKAAQVSVEVLEREDDRVLLSGIDAGQVVVTEGVQKLRPGSTVTEVTTPPDAG